MADDSDERTMELTIEALTGTVYDLCVSPYETILGIKMKVQRLEGIPVYQQQLVWGGTELQDEFCLEEYSIPSGAQLKLLVAMRGGPIHAQRVHLDLEDPTLLEIAELLDSQCGDKYTLMLLRNGDDLDHASFVQVQMLEEEDTMRLSPIPVAEPGQHLSLATSKATCTEHAVTRDKMKELMAKFKKGREFRQAPPPLPNQPSGQLSRKGTGKVLILESRAPSRILHNPSSRVTPLSSAHANEARLAQRKLVFPGDTCSRLHHQEKSRKRMASCSLSSRRVHSPSNETPIISRKACSRLSDKSKELADVTPCRSKGTDQDRVPGDALEPFTSLLPTPPKRLNKADLPGKSWHKASKRRRRTSYVEQEQSQTTISDLSKNLSRLEICTPLAPIEQSPVTEAKAKEFLPPIICPSPHHPTVSYTRNKTLTPPLPSLSIATTCTAKQNLNVTRKKRCMKCGKKMGLASTYSCRCGGLFCAIHRYAETHSCTFDYKTEGRQILARTNPVVAAQKLPKI